MSAINKRFDEQRDFEILVPMEDKEAALSAYKQRLNDTDYMLVQKNGDKVKEIDLVVDEVGLGRGLTNTIIVDHDTVKDRHA